MGTLFACLSMLMQRSFDMNGYEGAIQKMNTLLLMPRSLNMYMFEHQVYNNHKKRTKEG